MRKLAVLATAFAILSVATVPCLAQHGSIDPAADPGGASCVLLNTGFFPIEIVARPNLAAPAAGFYAVEFGVDLAAFLAAGGGFIAGEVSLGAVTTGSINPGPGVQVGFAACQLAPVVHVYTINVFLPGIILTQEYVSVTPSTLATNILGMADCSPLRTTQPAIGGQALTNGSCSIGVEETTWGKLKALYGEE